MNAACVAVLFAVVCAASATVVAPVAGLGQQYYVPTAYSGVQYVQQPQTYKYVQQQQYTVPSTQQYVYKTPVQYTVPSASAQQYQYTVPSYYSSPVVSTYGAAGVAGGVYSPSLVYGYGK